jgi:hypothetical protein
MATYGSEQGVEGINAHMVGGYTATTTPTSTQVATFLAQGAAALDAAFAKAGYTTPVAASVACYSIIVRLNDLYAAACAEQAVNISTAGPGEETRSEKLWKQYKTELTDFLSGDLTLAGLSLAATAATAPRQRIRSLPLRKYDGYAANADRADY